MRGLAVLLYGEHVAWLEQSTTRRRALRYLPDVAPAMGRPRAVGRGVTGMGELAPRLLGSPTSVRRRRRGWSRRPDGPERR